MTRLCPNHSDQHDAWLYARPQVRPALVQIGGTLPPTPHVKVVLGPGTGLGMAVLAPQLIGWGTGPSAMAVKAA